MSKTKVASLGALGGILLLIVIVVALALNVAFWSWLVMLFAPLFMDGTLSYTASIPYGILATIIVGILKNRS